MNLAKIFWMKAYTFVIVIPTLSLSVLRTLMYLPSVSEYWSWNPFKNFFLNTLLSLVLWLAAWFYFEKCRFFFYEYYWYSTFGLIWNFTLQTASVVVAVIYFIFIRWGDE